MKSKQLSYAPAELRPNFCGYAYPLIMQFQDALKKQIMLLCYNEPKSVSELSEELQTGYEYIQSAVDGLYQYKLLEKKDGKYTTLIPLIHLSKDFEATAVKNKLVWEKDIPKKIVELTYSLKDEISALDFYGNTFDIKYLNWIFFVMIYNKTQGKLRTYFSGKTDEVVVDDYAWRTQNFDASAIAYWKYADEHPEDDAPECKQRVECWSTFYNHIGDIGVNNVFDASPFPAGFDEKTGAVDYNRGRNIYITKDNIGLYLDLVKGADVEMNETNKKIVDEFIKHGVVVKNGEKLVPMVPVIPKDAMDKIEQLIFQKLTPLIKEIADEIGSKIEEILLPCLGDVKIRKDHFYSFWVSEFLNPREELFWYGMNVDGLEIPKDYNQSVAGMWITY